MKKKKARLSKQSPTSEKKLRARNFPLWLLRELFVVAQYGEEKHGTYDFLTTEELTVNSHLDALKRHLIKFEDPNICDFDDESKELHLFHVAWRALVAAYVMKHKPHLDDRYKGVKK